MTPMTIRDYLDDIRGNLDLLAAAAGDLGAEVEHKRYLSEVDGSFIHVIGDTGAELLTDDGGDAYIDVSTVEKGVIDLDDDSVADLIEALRALQAFRAAQTA